MRRWPLPLSSSYFTESVGTISMKACTTPAGSPGETPCQGCAWNMTLISFCISSFTVSLRSPWTRKVAPSARFRSDSCEAPDQRVQGGSGAGEDRGAVAHQQDLRLELRQP